MIEEKNSRTYNLQIRKKLLEKIKKIKDKTQLIEVFKIVNKDIGENFSKNKSGIYFNLNILSDNAIGEIIEIVQIFNINETVSETTVEDKITYKSYSENELDIYNSLGPRLSNQEKSILKKLKNIN